MQHYVGINTHMRQVLGTLGEVQHRERMQQLVEMRRKLQLSDFSVDQLQDVKRVLSEIQYDIQKKGMKI